MIIFRYIWNAFRKRSDIHNGYPVFVAPSRIHGNGVFAAMDIANGATIEIAPFIPVQQHEFRMLKGTSLHYSYFLTSDENNPAVIGMGLAGLYNHACPASAEYRIRMSDRTIRFHAIRKISKGEEITINYNGAATDPTPVQFNLPA